MSVRISATFQYVDQVGCACSSVPCPACCSAMGLLDEVDEREDHDPHHVDEVPVQRRDIDNERVLGSEPAAAINGEERQQPEHTNRHVRAVEARQREERRTEEV